MKQVSVCPPPAAPGEREQRETHNTSNSALAPDLRRTIRKRTPVFRHLLALLVEALPGCQAANSCSKGCNLRVDESLARVILK